MRLFAERGFHGVRTRELAESAGVSEALVFRHFPTKESIVRAILDEAGFAERIQEMEARLEAMPPRQALLSIAESLLTRLKEHPDRFRVVFFGLLETPHLASEFYQRFLSRLLALETRIFKRAFAVQGSDLPGSQVDPSVVARSVPRIVDVLQLVGGHRANRATAQESKAPRRGDRRPLPSRRERPWPVKRSGAPRPSFGRSSFS